jgi:hypothetical protein
MLDYRTCVQINKSGESGLRQGANRSEVRPRTAEQGSAKPGAGAPRSGDAPRTRYAKRRCGKGRTRLRSIFVKRGALRLLPQASLRLTGRSRTSVAERKRTATKPNLCALPGSDPHGTWGPSSAVQCAPRAGMRPGSGMPSHWDKRGLAHTYAVASQKGPLFRAPLRTPREDL